jgi:multisubunit Na+/H+ antiporter MnhF subunit
MAESAYKAMFEVAVILLAVGAVFTLVRAILGPRVTDRILGAGMAGTIVTIIIALLSYVLDEAYLLDVCLLYCLLNFLTVIVLVKVFMARHREREFRRSRNEEEEDHV